MTVYANDWRVWANEDGSWTVLSDEPSSPQWRVFQPAEEGVSGWLALNGDGFWLVLGRGRSESARTFFATADLAIAALIGEPRVSV